MEKKKDDLIYRSAVIEAILGSFNAIKAIEGLPAVDATPVVHGRWVDADGNPVAWSKALPSSPEGFCICSVCDTWLVGSDELPVYGLYCPACGARMDGEADG